MVGKIPILKEWKQFIEETKKAGNIDSAHQMNMVMLNVVAVDVAAETCDPREMLASVLSVAYGLKNIAMDDTIDPVKRNKFAREIFDYIDEQSEIFSEGCTCVTSEEVY